MKYKIKLSEYLQKTGRKLEGCVFNCSMSFKEKDFEEAYFELQLTSIICKMRIISLLLFILHAGGIIYFLI